MANNSKRNSNRAGAVLITVLTVACFAAILLTAVLTFVKRAHTNAFNNYNSEQAYYIASSALGSVHDYFEQEKTQNYPTLVSYAEAGTEGTITLGNDAISSLIPGGDCKVNISKVNEGYIRLSVTGYYNGQAETINAYYAVTPGQKASGIDNALYSNGEANFEKPCTNTGSVTTAGDYFASTNSVSAGSIISEHDFNVTTSYTWQNDPNGSANSYIVAGHNCYFDQGTFIVKPTHAKTNDNVSQFLAVGGLAKFHTHVEIGDENTPENKFDVYCSTAKFTGNSVSIYGNFYVYKLDNFAEIHNATCGCDTQESENGDLILSNSGDFDIYGDVFVEGDISLYNSDPPHRIIHGTLYVSPTTEFLGPTPSVEGDRLVVDAISGDGLTTEKVRQWINAGYLRINGVSGTTDADLAGKVLTDPINHGSGTSRNYKPSTKFDPDYIKHYETTPEFLNKSDPANVAIKNKYINAVNTNLKDYIGSHHDAELGIDFDYYVDGKLATDNGNGFTIDTTTVNNTVDSFFNQPKKVLVDMNQISGDYVIRVKGIPYDEYVWDGDLGTTVVKHCNAIYMPTIIVKNGTRSSDGTWTSDKGEGCLYVIADDTVENNRIIFSHSGIIDYYTYEFVIQKDYGLNIGGYGSGGNGVVELNATSGYTAPDGTDHGIYTPSRTRMFVMLNPNDSLVTLNSQNRSDSALIEAVVYASQASCEIKTYGVNTLLFLRDTNNNQLSFLSTTSGSARLTIMGAIICESITSDQEFGVGFIPPSTETNLGGNGGSEDVGSVTFSHYESR